MGDGSGNQILLKNMAENTSNHTILSDVEITGSINFKGQLTFDGTLKKGTITGESLVIGKTADIHGNIQADSLTIHGRIAGDIVVSGKCEVSNTADFAGTLTANRISMADGASVNGQVRIGSVPATPVPVKKN
jgi:cytoskeletal protein CcmA (bactofilin family)